MASTGPHGTVWRVGYRPNPWAWPDWKWASGGRFPGRWDDREGTFRTIYVAESLLACLLEVLAVFRPDTTMAAEMATIETSEDDEQLHPTSPAGVLGLEWVDSRIAGIGQLHGTYCAVTATESVAALRPTFLDLAHELGRADFDVACLKDGGTRRLTQSVATFVYETTRWDGVQFASRHGDDLTMWAVFERADDPPVSPCVHDPQIVALSARSPEMVEAFRIHGLRWDA